MKLLAISLLLITSGISGTTNLTPEQIKKRDILLGKDKKDLVGFLLEAETIIETQEKENQSLKDAYTNQSLEYGSFKKEVKLTAGITEIKHRERRVRQTGIVAVVSTVLTLTGVILFRGAVNGWNFKISTSGLSPGFQHRF